MSLLGETVDNFLIGLGSITDIILNLLSGIGGLISGILNLFSILVSFLYYIYLFLAVIVTILINPYSLLMVIFGCGFWYSAFTANSRKDMLIKLGIYYKYVFETSAKILMSAYTIVSRFIVGIIDTI
jgi:hypothetical protein